MQVIFYLLLAVYKMPAPWHVDLARSAWLEDSNSNELLDLAS